MTKYIVKNCPCYEWGGCHYEHVEHECCSKNADCPIKQVVEMCKDAIDNNPCTNCPDRGVECWQCDHEYEYRAGNPELEIPKKILQTLQVEEVE